LACAWFRGYLATKVVGSRVNGLHRRAILGTGVSFAFANSAWAQPPAELVGEWTATMPVLPSPLTLRLMVSANGAVELENVTNRARLRVRVSSLSPHDVQLTFPQTGASFSGRLTQSDRLEGFFTQGAAVMLVFGRGPVAPAPTARGAAAPMTQEALEAMRRSADMPALACAAKRREQPLQQWGAGRRTRRGAEIQANDRWHLGSITKSMTATLAGRMVDLGQCPASAPLGQKWVVEERRISGSS
jgi:hypothetical protein